MGQTLPLQLTLVQFVEMNFRQLIAVDEIVTTILSSIIPQNYLFESIFRFLSADGWFVALWPIMSIVVFFVEYINHKNHILFVQKIIKVSVVLTIATVVTFVGIHFVLKPIFDRERPYITKNVSQAYCPKDYSFPSGHASVAWAGAYVLIKFDSKRRREIAYCLIATFISYSRIYLSCHYFGDILAGTIYGTFVGALVFEFYRRLFLTDKKLKFTVRN
jgi:membrane-associated phospholipid phosphatase